MISVEVIEKIGEFDDVSCPLSKITSEKLSKAFTFIYEDMLCHVYVVNLLRNLTLLHDSFRLSEAVDTTIYIDLYNYVN